MLAPVQIQALDKHCIDLPTPLGQHDSVEGAMHETTQARNLLMRPAVYRIRVDGRLDPRWSARPGGLVIAIQEKPGQPTITEITGSLPDQAAYWVYSTSCICTSSPC
jgi:hypothetical protein